MWEIETTSVGNDSAQGAVGPGQQGYVGSLLRGVDITTLPASTKLDLTVDTWSRVGCFIGSLGVPSPGPASGQHFPAAPASSVAGCPRPATLARARTTFWPTWAPSF